jgi:hypothetical protein
MNVSAAYVASISNAGFSITYPSALSDETGAGGNESFKMIIYFNSDDHIESICVYVDDSHVRQHVTPQDV